MAARIAVIVPTYNRATLVTEAIESLLSQSRVPDEIIVVDDGSTDETWQLLQQYSTPVIPIRQTNQGRSEARNTGIIHSTGDLIAFLDSDDILPPQSIECRAGWLEEHPDNQGVYGITRAIDMKGAEIADLQANQEPAVNLFAQLARYNVIPITSIMLRRSILPSPPYFNPRLHILEDWEFLLRVTQAHPRLHRIPDVVSYYRQHESMTLPISSNFEDSHIRIQDAIFGMGAFQDLPPAFQARIACSHALARLRAGYTGPARRSLRLSIKTAPWYPASYILWILSLLPLNTTETLYQFVKGHSSS